MKGLNVWTRKTNEQICRLSQNSSLVLGFQGLKKGSCGYQSCSFLDTGLSVSKFQLPSSLIFLMENTFLVPYFSKEKHICFPSTFNFESCFCTICPQGKPPCYHVTASSSRGSSPSERVGKTRYLLRYSFRDSLTTFTQVLAPRTYSSREVL